MFDRRFLILAAFSIAATAAAQEPSPVQKKRAQQPARTTATATNRTASPGALPQPTRSPAAAPMSGRSQIGLPARAQQPQPVVRATPRPQLAQSTSSTAATSGLPAPTQQAGAAMARLQNAQIVNNWNSPRFNAPQYAAFRNYQRVTGDHRWWRAHYNRITFLGGAPYYWNAGYWFPAWGFYDGYNFDYDGPIYAWHDLPPQRIVPQVQRALAAAGYYPGTPDGLIGPMTRQALAAWQRDHGLPITSAIDQPTLASLGLT